MENVPQEFLEDESRRAPQECNYFGSRMLCQHKDNHYVKCH